ncbi:MAG: hypothetical protein FJ202_13070, partial [Gemmatimonadetes bacterium]|nr:hypothetical protein [Gemmatimonadota bacterium]
MHSVRECADLLAGVRSARQVDRLAAALGFDAPLALDREGAAAIGLRGCASAARVAGGPGLLRLCVVTLADDDSPSAGMARCANRLMQHAPHFLWLVIAVQARTRSLVLGVPPSSSAARVTALLMDTARILESDAETVAAMAAAVGSSDQMTHHRWAELLGRDQLTRRFYRELEGAVHRLAASRTGRAP